jgi:hypothetical protein
MRGDTRLRRLQISVHTELQRCRDGNVTLSFTLQNDTARPIDINAVSLPWQTVTSPSIEATDVTTGRRLVPTQLESGLVPILMTIPPHRSIEGSVPLTATFPEIQTVKGHRLRIDWKVALRTNDGVDDTVTGSILVSNR